jgi:AraC-like DNA-binding protein
MKSNKPIKLDFERLRDYMRQGILKNDGAAYIAKDFAVLLSFRKLRKTFLTFNQPYRLDELRIGRVTNGTAKITINLIDYTISKGMMLFVGGGSIIQPINFSPDFDMEAISVNDELLQMLFNGRVPSCLISGEGKTTILIKEEEENIFHRLVEDAWLIIHLDSLNTETFFCVIRAILCMYNNLNNRTENNEESHTHEREVFLKFINLVHKFSKQERSLGFYADKMCISQRYLGTLISNASDTTAKEWIDKSVVAEAKVMLKHSDMQVAQISEALNFPNASFFCKFFKRLTSTTPQEYRNE